MWDPIENTMTRECDIFSGLKANYQHFLESPDQTKDDEKECPKTEKMYERIECMKKAGKAKIGDLELQDESLNHNISTSRGSKDKSIRRKSKKLPKGDSLRILSRESNRENSSSKKVVKRYQTTESH
jgi:hypothetical protein